MAVPLEQWADRIEATLERPRRRFARVVVLRETDSTQAAARRLDAQPGTIITTSRQVAGAGRLGRRWADTSDEGIAVSLVIEAGASEQLAMTFALAAAEAVQTLLDRAGRPHRAEIKWPNDIVIGRRKIVGILVEQSDGRAIAGIGMNVLQRRWPAELESRAVSLAQLGAVVDRLDAIETLVSSVSDTLDLDDSDELAARYADRNVLLGAMATLQSGDRTIQGRVGEVDPRNGLVIETAHGVVSLPAATTSVVQYEPCADSAP